jgi:hypothetical protein
MAKAKKGEVLEVEIIISPEVLENNPNVKEHYDLDKKTISYEVGENIPKDFKDELQSFLVVSSESEIVSFNPIMESLSKLQEFKELKYDKENKETVQAFKDAKKFIGSFNTSLTGAKKILKDPHIEYNRKVDAIYNFFKQESDNTKNALEVNFDEHLKEEQAKKDAAEAKKKAAELEQIAKLAEENKAQQEKMATQQKHTRKLEVEAEINKITFEASTKSPNLNLDGLKALKQSLNGISVNSLFKSDDIFTDDEKGAFEKLFTDAVFGAITMIDSYIKNFELEIEKQNLQTANTNLTAENKVLEAQTPASLVDDENDTPFGPPKTTQEQIPAGDLATFVSMYNRLVELKLLTDNVFQNIKASKFDEPSLEKMRLVLADQSMPQVVEWTGKLESWTKGKLDKYKEFIQSK